MGFGEVLLSVCPCEIFTRLMRNFGSRRAPRWLSEKGFVSKCKVLSKGISGPWRKENLKIQHLCYFSTISQTTSQTQSSVNSTCHTERHSPLCSQNARLLCTIQVPSVKTPPGCMRFSSSVGSHAGFWIVSGSAQTNCGQALVLEDAVSLWAANAEQ